eukprot:CAMPEP_0118921152 /NCGR_PEP_ID=MMETSP1169-20130426/526_1 /TAXON_ID=36882 /ORGANISM="Pyramimonas obovata, Strain CCMP722" /LENGTH=59 /DNA_ID=CAMNT_0006861827 /DNA_START=87 /DNA_END=263 /DNA_ORIENTATION=+
MAPTRGLVLLLVLGLAFTLTSAIRTSPKVQDDSLATTEVEHGLEGLADTTVGMSASRRN